MKLSIIISFSITHAILTSVMFIFWSVFHSKPYLNRMFITNSNIISNWSYRGCLWSNLTFFDPELDYKFFTKNTLYIKIVENQIESKLKGLMILKAQVYSNAWWGHKHIDSSILSCRSSKASKEWNKNSENLDFSWSFRYYFKFIFFFW